MQLAVLGPLELEGERRTVAVTGRKARQLLTLLTLAAPDRMSLDRLIDALWDDPPTAAAKTVQGHLSRLRTALAAAGSSGSLAGGSAGYSISLEHDVLDLHRLERLWASADASRSAGDAEAAADLLGAARALWRGEPELPDSTFGEQQHRRLVEQRTQFSEAHLGALIDAGHSDQAVAELEGLVVAEPLRERLWELHMLALYHCGRQSDALRTYRRARSTLLDEIGVEPGQALRALESAILAHEVIPLGPPFECTHAHVRPTSRMPRSRRLTLPSAPSAAATTCCS